jgi:hypothetical protein
VLVKSFIGAEVEYISYLLAHLADSSMSPPKTKPLGPSIIHYRTVLARLLFPSWPRTKHFIFYAMQHLFASWRSLSHHRGLLFLESLANSFATGHELLYATGDASGLAGYEGLGGEVIDAVVEAAVNEAGEHLSRESGELSRYDEID